MEVKRFVNTGVSGNKKLVTDKPKRIVKPADKKPVPARESTINKAQVKAALDKVIKNTRFKYEIRDDELGYFIVRIIDKNTDKIIREIPSKESQKIHDHINRVLGIIFDEMI